MLLGLNCHLTELIGTGGPRGLWVGRRGENALPFTAVEVVATWVSVFPDVEMLSGSCCPVLLCYSICLSFQWPSCLLLLFALPALKWRKSLLASASDIYLVLSSQLCTLFFLHWAIFLFQNHHYITGVPSFSVSLPRVQRVKSPDPNVLLDLGQ